MRSFPAKASIAYPRPACARCARGFTLIELMFVIVILAVLLSLAAPSLSALVRDQRVKTVVGDVHASLLYARSEAIKRNCDISIVAAGDWADGWSVQTAAACPGGTISLKAQDALEGLDITLANGNPVGNVIYRGDGRLVAAPASDIVIRSSAPGATTTARCVRIDLSGRPNIMVDTNQNPADGCQ